MFLDDLKQPARDRARESQQDADTGNRGPFAKERCGIVERRANFRSLASRSRLIGSGSSLFTASGAVTVPLLPGTDR
jgi:hypothetical protein